jgi:clan AA aspartic protease
MGEIVVAVQLENAIDRALQRRGALPEGQVRQLTVQAVVDTGAVMLVLPQDVVHKLGLTEQRTVLVRYADERTEERPVAEIVTLTIGDRTMTTECIVGPPLSEPLLGQIVLERLDLLADCQNQQLRPRPESPYYPLLKLK